MSSAGYELNDEFQRVSPIQILLSLIREIELYDQLLLRKPAILAFSQMDLPDAEQNLERFLADLELAYQGDFDRLQLPEQVRPASMIRFERVLPISSFTAHNMQPLRELIRDQIDIHHERQLLQNAAHLDVGKTKEN